MAGISLRGKTWHLRMRVPRRYQAVVERREIHRSLGTDSRRRAETLLPAVEADIMAELEARLALREGRSEQEAYQSAVALSRSRGFRYRSLVELQTASTGELVERVEALAVNDGPEMAKALLGGAPAPSLKVSELVELIERISAHENRFKSENQMRLWRHPRNRAVSNLISAVGHNIEVQGIGAAQALQHRNWWSDRMEKKGVSAETANKDFSNMAGMLRRYYEHINMPDPPRPYAQVTITERHRKRARVPEMPVEWIREHWFAEGALDGLNDQARDILLISIETGCRQAEIHDLPAGAIILDASIPHLRIENTDGDERREVKNAPSCRHVPLVGVALAAAKRHPDGFPRYRGSSGYSATVNKYLRARGLMPSPKHTVKGTRHAWESRLKAAGVQSDDRGEMMGHDVSNRRNRELYGDEMPLAKKRELAELVALDVPEHLK